jgi:ankyrin repeat protein
VVGVSSVHLVEHYLYRRLFTSSAIIKKVMALDEAGFLAGLTAYYYFDFRSKAKQDLRGLLSSLVVQFCAKSDPCYQILLRLYSTHYNGSQLPDDDALVQCLKEMLAALLEQPRIYLIVDALDECPCTSGVVSPRDSVLELIEDLVESRLPNLRICVTSRPEADILESLGPLATHTVSLHDEDGQKQDIVDHVTFVVHSDRRMRKWRVEDKKLVIDTLSEKADGMCVVINTGLKCFSFGHRFRWVFCQLEALRHRIPGMIARALKELPQTLDETYGRILSGIDKDIQEYAHRLFQCLCVSIRPLRLAELAEALSIIFVTKPESEDYIDWRSEESQQALLSSCSSIVTVVNTDGSPVVQFAHFSVREYLMSDRLAMPGERYTRYHVRPHSSHVTLARASLGALLSLGDQVDERAVEEYHPLAIYGAHHWVDHVKFGTVSLGIQDLMERLFDRNSPYFATWVWIYDFDHPFRGQMTTTHPEEPEASPLYYAALCSLPNIIENLAMTHPGDVNGIGGRYATPLNAALAKGDLNVAQVLLECGVDVNSQGDKGRSPLHLASLSGNCDTVQWLLAHQADINIAPTDEMHVTPLLLAAFYGRLEVCLLLVGHGAHIDAPGEASGSPLQAASICGHLDIVLFLLNCGASLDYRNYEGQTTLAMASRFGCTEVVRLLIKRGADVASRDDNRLTPLHHASKQGHANIVQDLLDNRGDPNAQDQDLQTPLHLASDAGYLGIVQLLIQHGSVLDTTDRHQDTPLHLALRNGNPEIARTLIKNGANTISEDRDGHTPLHHASQHELLDLMGILLQGGVDVNIRNSFKKTPLHLASGGGEVDLVGFLIERGADVNVEDVALSSPLHYASANGHLDVAELLIERGADIHKQTSLQEIPLHLSSDNGRLEVVRFLVRCGSHVGSRNFEGQSSLHVAAREGHQDIVELLLESGADINVRDINYELPLDVASRNGKVKVARFLAEQMGLAPPDVVSQDGESVSRPLLKGENGGSDQETLNDKDNMTMQEASRRGLFTVVQFLLDRGIDVNSRNKCRETSLHAASENGILEVAQLLIDRGADVDCRNNNGEAPLHLSSTSGNVDIVRLLLDRGAHVDTICQDRLTPLHRASEKDHFEVAQLLIERGADVNAVGDYGVTPLRMALFVDSEDCRIIQLLMDHGAT